MLKSCLSVILIFIALPSAQAMTCRNLGERTHAKRIERQSPIGFEDYKNLLAMSDAQGANFLTQYSLLSLLDYIDNLKKFNGRMKPSEANETRVHEQINLALVRHPARWQERLDLVHDDSHFRTLDRNSWGFRGPNLVDAFLGYNSYLVTKKEGAYLGDQATGAKERTWTGGAPWSHYEDLQQNFVALDLKDDTKFVDLGAGVGRVGLALMIFHPTANFIGYEYVPGRVKAANAWAKKMGIEDRFQVIEQDLSDPNFQLPIADIFYMYQPFNGTTAKIVMGKLEDLSDRQSFTIISKAMGIYLERPQVETVYDHRGNSTIYHVSPRAVQQ
jgi:hypothetical protein